jgi:hypothetical protein
VVTSLSAAAMEVRFLYEEFYCARGDLAVSRQRHINQSVKIRPNRAIFRRLRPVGIAPGFRFGSTGVWAEVVAETRLACQAYYVGQNGIGQEHLGWGVAASFDITCSRIMT